MSRRIFSVAICCVLLLSFLTRAVNPQDNQNNQPSHAIVTVTYAPGHPAHRFIPSHALGAGIDGASKGTLDLQLSPQNIQAMLSAGLKPLTYRLRTELANEVWHWNPNGSWSDARNDQGYWVSESNSDAPISLAYGYRLPRR